jgi:hypothetical protein
MAPESCLGVGEYGLAAHAASIAATSSIATHLSERMMSPG